MEYDVRTRVESGVTLVAARVRCDSPRRIRVVNELDGPAWPPRTNGAPDSGWTESAYEASLDAGEAVAVGYATPAPVRDPVVSVETVDDTGEDDLDPVRDLSDPRPPRDALPSRVPPAVSAWLDDVESRQVEADEYRVLARAARIHERVDR